MNYAEMLDDPWKGIIIEEKWCLVPAGHMVKKLLISYWTTMGFSTKSELLHCSEGKDYVKMPKSAIEGAIVRFNNSVAGISD